VEKGTGARHPRKNLTTTNETPRAAEQREQRERAAQLRKLRGEARVTLMTKGTKIENGITITVLHEGQHPESVYVEWVLMNPAHQYHEGPPKTDWLTTVKAVDHSQLAQWVTRISADERDEAQEHQKQSLTVERYIDATANLRNVARRALSSKDFNWLMRVIPGLSTVTLKKLVKDNPHRRKKVARLVGTEMGYGDGNPVAAFENEVQRLNQNRPVFFVGCDAKQTIRKVVPVDSLVHIFKSTDEFTGQPHDCTMHLKSSAEFTAEQQAQRLEYHSPSLGQETTRSKTRTTKKVSSKDAKAIRPTKRSAVLRNPTVGSQRTGRDTPIVPIPADPAGTNGFYFG
jgi:hypothetical protein